MNSAHINTALIGAPIEPASAPATTRGASGRCKSRAIASPTKGPKTTAVRLAQSELSPTTVGLHGSLAVVGDQHGVGTEVPNP